MIGQTISHYKIHEKLGEGGMGVVYKAEDLKLKRIVALKMLPRQAVVTDADKARFEREAQAAANLNHPNIATIYEFDEVEGQAFIAMEYIEGKTLKQKIAERPLPIEEAIDVAIATAEGLSKAHEREIIHRDIKADNVMTSKDGQVKIMDFGLAAVAGRSRVTKEGMTVGTVSYMSPEQALGEKLDQRTDIWSLGVVLYEMVTGRLPFSGDYEQAIVYRILNEEPEPITSIRSNVPMELERIVRKAMQKDRTARYQSAGDLLVDLTTLGKEIGSGVRAEGTPPRVKMNKMKRKQVYVYGALAMLVVAIALGVFYFYPAESQAIDSIAVLPLENLSHDPDQDYFADGMTEALITELAQISSMRVISRTSVLRYKSDPPSLPEIARELDVDAVIEGSVLRVGDRVRITAQLLHAPTDRNLWAKSYERDLQDILRLQREVARAITGEIKIELTPQEESRLGDFVRVDPEAYSAYLRGRYHYNKFSEDDILRSIELYNEAIAGDSTFGLPYAGLAHAYSALRSFYLPPREVMPKAKAAALKAVELDENLAEAHVALATVLLFYDWDWDDAEREFKRAIELNPNLAAAHKYYAWCLSATGRHPEAIAHMERALLLDPVSPLTLTEAGWAFYLARQYDRAVEASQKAVELAPDFWFGYTILGLALEKAERFSESIEALQKADQLGTTTATLEMLAGVFAASGQTGKAREVLKRLTKLSRQHYVCPYEVSTVYAGLGDYDRTMEWLEKGYAERADCMPWVASDPKLDSLHSLPRFQALLKRMNFPE